MVAEDLPVFQVLDCLKERLVTAAKGEKSFTGALYGLQVLPSLKYALCAGIVLL